ncbi:tetratricopeptide repeat protein [Iningainema tapete]|uniref:protein O-GlcNAc transferase n=1 Tax=Iningainema tapete BLCC-T55 TaxID=2748662 RepID=A0A8J6XF62_9CYAN|nr:tetratricopeptide repeat protein [Iningainema tapete]MBD2771522.1 tetratricopeptide repeat protein [Iningainema tapete BLCC-T55]
MNTENISESNIISLFQTAIQKQYSGQLNEAETIYKQILETQPEDGEGQISLGNLFHPFILNFGYVLHQQGKLTEAIKLYQQSLIIDPNFAEVYNSLGNAFQSQGQLSAAIQSYRQAINIKPDFAYAHNNLANALKEQNLDEEAIYSYRQAISIQPDLVDAHYNLGTVLHKQGQLEASTAAYQQVLNIKPDFAAARFGICINQLPIIYSTVDEIQLRRNQYQHHLQELAHHYQFAPDQEQAQAAKMVGYLQPFYLPYQGLNDRGLQQIYGEMICQLMARSYPKWSKPIELTNVQAQEKVRVGFVSGFFRQGSCWKLLKGWLENLDKSEFELFGYHTGSQRDQETVIAAKALDKFIQGPLPLEKWCELIQLDKLHILIFPEIGMDPTTVQLGCLRLAPIKMACWMHPQTSGLATIDYFLSNNLMEPENAQDHYTEKLIKLPNLGIHYTPEEIKLQAISKQEIGIANNEIMFWCCQSLYKYLPQHDDVFPQIAQALRRCKFVFFKHFASEHITEVFRQRLQLVFEDFGLNSQDYCIFLPRLNSVTFASTAATADVFLDSIGWSGGITSLETIAHNTPMVTLPGDMMRGRQTMGILKMMEIEETIATTKDDYVQIAVRLGQDAEYRQQISKQIAENKHKLYGDLRPIRFLEDFLLGVVNKPRKGVC